MNYHLHHRGQNLGIFPLEDLRRRRQQNELTGGELVWCQGMANWQPLDTVLGELAAKPAARPLPPPLPKGSGRKQLVVGLSIAGGALLVLAAVIWFGYRTAKTLAPRRPMSINQSDVSTAGKAVQAKAKTKTEADMQKKGGEFRVRQYIEGYRLRGKKNPATDAAAQEFLQAWVDYYYGEERKVEWSKLLQMADQLAGDPKCEDGIVLMATAAICPEVHETTKRLEKALKAFEDSKHRGYPKYYTLVSLASHIDENSERYSRLTMQAADALRDALTDGSILPDDQPEVAEMLINGWAKRFFERRRTVVTRMIAELDPKFQWLSLVMSGQKAIRDAWQARGGGYANTVKEEGWKTFGAQLQVARKNLTKAWELQPQYPQAPGLMVYVSLSDNGLEEMRLWFDRTIAAQLDYEDAWSHMRWGLRPRWHGSLESMRAFGLTALNTKRFDTDVPRKLFDSITDIEAEEDVKPGEHIYGRADIWPYMQQMYEGYLAEPKQAKNRECWLTCYAAAAYLAGKYDVARKQLEKLDWKPLPDRLQNWNADLSLLAEEVAARTGPLADGIATAEQAATAKKIDESLRYYKSVPSASLPDARTRAFVQARLATLEMEKRLQTGEWVDFLPAAQDDPAWNVVAGTYQWKPDGAVEVKSQALGHMVLARARLGQNFEVKGEFEVVQSSTQSYQAGLAFGAPHLGKHDWFGYRLKNNDVEGQVSAFSHGWTKRGASQAIALDNLRNTFEFRFYSGKASGTLNGKQIFKDTPAPVRFRTPIQEFSVGVGAYNDMNETVIRYRHLQIRQLMH